MNTLLAILIFVLGLILVAVLLIGAVGYAHWRSDAEMGVADTQGREATDAETPTEDPAHWGHE